MSFNSETPRTEFTASAGQELFTFLFKIYDKTDLVVYQTPVGQEPNDAADILTVDTDYTVTISGDSGGSITLITAAAAGDTLVLLRELETVRDVEYQTNGDLLAETLNDDQNYQTYLIADLGEARDRSLILSQASVGVSNEMPPVESQRYIRWKLDGTGLENAQGTVQEITEFNDTDFRLKSTTNIKLQYSLAALTALRTWTVPDKNIDFGEIYTKTESDAITDLKLDTSATAQTKIGDLTIGETESVASWSYVGTTITVNTSAIHNLSVGQHFSVSGLVATTNAPNGRWVVATVVDTDTITFTADDTPTGAATVSSAELKHGDIEANGDIIGNNTLVASCNFNGADGVIHGADNNVASILRVSTGVYRLNYKTPVENAIVSISGSINNGIVTSNGVYTVDYCEFNGVSTSGAVVDRGFVSVHVFGGKN